MKLRTRFALSLVAGCLMIVYLFSTRSSLSSHDLKNDYHKEDMLYMHTGSEERFKTNYVLPCENIVYPRIQTDIDSGELLSQVQNDKAWSIYFKKIAQKSSEPDFSQPLHVVVVPFSHNDPGWLKTVDQYYEDQTSHILDNMVSKLIKYPDLTFMWEETVFLSMWWEKQSDFIRDQTRYLIDRGQLCISIGSWVMPDEANPHYFALIDQMIEGHSWLEDKLGPNARPVNTWGVDPFGYSSTLTYLYKLAGIKNMIILRVHEIVKDLLKSKTALHFNWGQEWDVNRTFDMVTYMMPSFLYHIGETCGPDSNICDMFDFSTEGVKNMQGIGLSSVGITEKNLHERATMLLNQYYRKAKLFSSHVLFVPLGADFKYTRSEDWDWQYGNYSKLFTYINRHPEWKVQIGFGTTKTYFEALESEKTTINTMTRFPRLVGDFFPYIDNSRYHWVGYFATRQMSKVLGRELEIHLRAAEILYTLALALKIDGNAWPQLDVMFSRLSLARRELALFQHHDSITGTSTEKATIHSQQRISKALVATMDVVENCTSSILGLSHGQAVHLTAPKFLRLRMVEKELVHVFDYGTKLVFFNSKLSQRIDLIRITIDSAAVFVTDNRNRNVKSQINPVWKKNNIPSRDVFELLFLIDLPPLTLVTYTIHPVNDVDRHSALKSELSKIIIGNIDSSQIKNKEFDIQYIRHFNKDISIENPHYNLFFRANDGMLVSTLLKQNNEMVNTVISFKSYLDSSGGAYVFSPESGASDTLFRESPKIYIMRGLITDEVHVVYSRVTHMVSLVKTSSVLGLAVQINNIINAAKKRTQETVMRLDTEIQSGNRFYTDLNGFKVTRRVSYKSVGVEGSYYPMTAFAFVQNQTVRVSLLAAQPMGVTSHEEGGLEVMMHRQVLSDDYRGMGENVEDTMATPTRFYLLFEKRDDNTQHSSSNMTKGLDPLPNPTLLTHHLVDHLRNYPLVLSSSAIISDSHQINNPIQFSRLSLPCDMELVNLRSLAKSAADVKSPRISAALIVRRLAAECGFHSHVLAQELRCEHTQKGAFIPSTLLSDIQVIETRRKSLSLMYDLGTVLLHKEVNLKPMDIGVFNITIQK